MEQRAQNLEEDMRARLARLTEELERGQEMLRALESQQRQLGETLLRISGARQILLELLGEEESSAQSDVVALNGGASEVRGVEVGATTDRE